MIETKRLLLRRLVSSDHEAFDTLFGDGEVMESSVHGTLSTEEVGAWLNRQIDGYGEESGIEVFAVEIRASCEVVGYCGMTRYPDIDGSAEIEIGFRLIRKYWGCGYATEAAIAVRDFAFSKLALPRLVALIEPGNARSIRVAEKLGMSFEKEVMMEGYDHPDHLYSMRHVPAADPIGSLPKGDMWVFGYGSLMWKPGFPHGEARPARIHGYHRALCVWSWVHRGTRERPGLVLGLDRGGSCIGIAHRVSAGDRDAVVEYLYARELVTNVYVPVVRPIHIEDVGRVAALAFIVDRGHDQYAGDLSAAHAARTIRDARGRSGANPEYFANTMAHLEALGIRCPRLTEIERVLSRD